jgi:succinyl-CoA synthetase beta subunit
MKLREYEAKNVIKEAGIPVPVGFLIRSAGELTQHLDALGHTFVLKAQVDVGGRGKAGGILMAGKPMAQEGKGTLRQADQGSASERDPGRTAT